MTLLTCQRPYSIRTRIKTRRHDSTKNILNCQRPYSIRTRIKTRKAIVRAKHMGVRDHIPLEQGLRHKIHVAKALAWECQRPYSIRTRIKTFNSNSARPLLCGVRDHIPLEQGLRLIGTKEKIKKEGQRPYSIRTRIKT